MALKNLRLESYRPCQYAKVCAHACLDHPQNHAGKANVVIRRATLRADAGNHPSSRPAPSREWAEHARTPRKPKSLARLPTSWQRSRATTAPSRSSG